MEKPKAESPPDAGPMPAGGGMLLLIFRVVLLMALGVATAFAVWHTMIQAEFAQAGDRFGYLQMAADMRRGAAPNGLPRFTFDSAQSRAMLAFLRARGLPVDNATCVGPAAYHYDAATDRIICQYPPGVAIMLRLLPEGRAVIIWRLLTLALLAGMGCWWCLRARAQDASLLAAALMTLAVMCGMLMVAMAVSYSVDMLILPLATAVAAAFASRRGGWLGWALAVLAGAAIGWAIVMRVAAAFFLPGFLPLAWSAESGGPRLWKRAGRVVAFLAACGAGVLPLPLHQQALSGSWLHSTYTPLDDAAPSLAFVGRNLAYYFVGEGSDLNWFLAAGAAAFAFWIVAQRRSLRAAAAGIGALCLWFCVPTAYFLTHHVITPYYQFHTLLMSLLAMAWIVGQTRIEPGSSRRGAIIAACGVALFAIFQVARLPWPTPQLERLSAMPDLTPPPALRDARAWILADRLGGTLWHYNAIPSLNLTDMDAATRLAFLKFLQARREPVILVADNPAMTLIARELQNLGATLTPAGAYCRLKPDEEAPFTSVYQVNW